MVTLKSNSLDCAQTRFVAIRSPWFIRHVTSCIKKWYIASMEYWILKVISPLSSLKERHDLRLKSAPQCLVEKNVPVEKTIKFRYLRTRVPRFKINGKGCQHQILWISSHTDATGVPRTQTGCLQYYCLFIHNFATWNQKLLPAH